MKIAMIIYFLLAVSGSCNNKKEKTTGTNIPSCIELQVKEFDKKDKPATTTQVDEYLYKGKRVFLFTAECCDRYNTVYDEQCKAICSPSGGLTGGGDHKCEDFSKEAKFVKQLWPVRSDK